MPERILRMHPTKVPDRGVNRIPGRVAVNPAVGLLLAHREDLRRTRPALAFVANRKAALRAARRKVGPGVALRTISGP